MPSLPTRIPVDIVVPAAIAIAIAVAPAVPPFNGTLHFYHLIFTLLVTWYFYWRLMANLYLLEYSDDKKTRISLVLFLSFAFLFVWGTFSYSNFHNFSMLPVGLGLLCTVPITYKLVYVNFD